MIRIFIIVLLSIIQSLIYSHPVTFKGGVALSSRIGVNTDTYINYSLSQTNSIGLRHYNLTTPTHISLYFAQLNHRLKRWYFFDAQANIYSILALGTTANIDSLIPCARLLLDYENRRFFSSIQAETMHWNDKSFLRVQSRLGLAPYKHKFNSVATWFMLQVEHLSYKQSTTAIIPLYRGFYKQYLWELGYNGRQSFGQIMVHI